MEEKLQEASVKVEIRPLSEEIPTRSGEDAKRGRLQQYLATIIVSLLALGFGTSVGWPAPTQVLLQSKRSPLGKALDDNEFSWLGSMVFLGGICGTLGWGRIADGFGRKMAGYCVAAAYVIGWTITLFSSSLVFLYAARFVLGFGGSGSLILCPLYIGEIADDAIRGTLGSYVILFFNGGIVLAYALGAILPYEWLTLCCVVVPVVFVFLFWWLPETPSHLWTKNRKTDAERALDWLKGGNSRLVHEECKRYASVIKKDEPQSCGTLVIHRGNRRALIIGMGLFAVQQFCGILVILTYTVAIFKASGSSISPNAATIAVGLFQLVSSYASSIIVDRAGRKVLLLISYGAMCLALLSLGLYFWFADKGYDLSSYGWIPVTSLSVHVITYALGAGPIPYVVVTDVLAPKIRGMATSVIIMWGTTLSFASVKLFPFLTDNLGNYGCFWFFAAFCALGFVFTLIVVPETKGRSLQEILAYMNGDPLPIDNPNTEPEKV